MTKYSPQSSAYFLSSPPIGQKSIPSPLEVLKQN